MDLLAPKPWTNSTGVSIWDGLSTNASTPAAPLSANPSGHIPMVITRRRHLAELAGVRGRATGGVEHSPHRSNRSLHHSHDRSPLQSEPARRPASPETPRRLASSAGRRVNVVLVERRRSAADRTRSATTLQQSRPPGDPTTFTPVDQVVPRFVADVDATALYGADERPARPDRPWVAVNMVASVDGAVTVEGRSGGLSGAGDKAIFFALRGIADVILVGAGTVRAENYGPPRISVENQAARVAHGQAPFPTIALVSGRLDLDPTRARVRRLAHPPDDPHHDRLRPGRRTALEPVAEIVVAGDGHVDPDLALARLHERDAKVVICEGGPTLNGALLASGVVDELCLTVAPVLVSGDDPRMARGPTVHPPDPLHLDRALLEDDFVFFRYLSVR